MLSDSITDAVSSHLRGLGYDVIEDRKVLGTVKLRGPCYYIYVYVVDAKLILTEDTNFFSEYRISLLEPDFLDTLVDNIESFTTYLNDVWSDLK